MLAPLVVVVVGSFSSDSYSVFPPRGLSTRWYSAFFQSEQFVQALVVSLKLGLCATALALALGVPVAVAMARIGGRASDFGRGIALLPLMVPSIVIGIAVLIFFSRLNLAGSFLGLVLAHSVLVTPFIVIIVHSGLSSIDRTLEEAARTLGAGPTVAFRTITLPLIKGSIVAASIFAFVTSFDELVVSLFLAGPNSTPLPVMMMQYLEYTSDPTIAAISTVVMVGSAIAVVAVERLVGFTRIM